MSFTFFKSAIFFLCTISLCLFIRCGANDEEVIPVVADFTADNAGVLGVTIQCGECVTFEDRSSGDVGSLFWDFEGGDPATSEEDFRVTVCYALPGKYDVSLSVNAGEDRIAKFGYVLVEGKPEELVADFTVDNNEIIEGQTVRFTDQSTGSPTSWAWVVGIPGGGFLESNAQDPQFTLLTPGSYSVTLTIGRDGDATFEEKIGFINVLSTDEFTCTVLNASAGGGSLFTDHTFNGLNQLTRADQFLNGILEEYITYQWNAEGLLERTEFFDVEAGILDTLLGAQFYEYTQSGQLQSQKFLDSRGNTTADYNFTINQGRIIGGTLDLSIGQGNFSRLDIEYTYDNTDLNVAVERFTFNGLLSERREYQFDSNHRALGDMQIEPFPNRSWKNNLIEAKFFNNQDQLYLNFSSTYEYNEFGRPSRELRDNGLDFIWEYDCEKK